jgi:hypothetical protein
MSPICLKILCLEIKDAARTLILRGKWTLPDTGWLKVNDDGLRLEPYKGLAAVSFVRSKFGS